MYTKKGDDVQLNKSVKKFVTKVFIQSLLCSITKNPNDQTQREPF